MSLDRSITTLLNLALTRRVFTQICEFPSMTLSVGNKRKLIFLWTYTEWGGAQMYMLTIIKQALEKWDVVVAIPRTSKTDLLDFYKPYNIPIDFLDYHFDPKVEASILGKIRRQFQRIRSEAEVYKYLRKFDLKESVLHIEIAPWQSWILLILLSLRGANVFTTLNNFRPHAPRWRRLVWKARFRILCLVPGLHIAASNREVKESLSKWLTPRYWESVPVAYSPIDPKQITESRKSLVDLVGLRKRIGVSKKDFVVLAVGQFIDRKGRWVLLEAARIVLDKYPDTRFVWLMPEQISEEDQRKIESYDLHDRFVPVMSRTVGTDRISILNFFRMADVFALPSVSEGLPLALIEAMALGVPSISTNVFAIPEAITNEKTGILIEAEDSVALAGAILRLRADPLLRTRLSENGSKFAIENFDGRIMASTYLDHYEKCFER